MTISYWNKELMSLIFFSFLYLFGFAQNQTQTIRGEIHDFDTKEALVGATIAIQNSEIGTATDNEGIFKLEKVPVGRYVLEVNYLGYDRFIFSEILLESGKELVLKIEMKPTGAELNEVVVRGNALNQRDKVYPAHDILTIEETLRLPATFFDPARLAFSYAGVTSNNDQANHMIVRGNSPNNNSWRLEGIEIVNPNHLGNAGTNTDRPARNGGGVNILSAQMLGNSTFMRGAFPVAYGNALSSVMDMSLRKGNDKTYEFTGQIGVIGIDLAAEGPLSKNSKASFLTNYRYSTLGLLGAAGVDLGDEAINFQDFALTVNIPLNKRAELTFFGFGGGSKNQFSAKEIEEIETQKDVQNILFKSNMAVGGLKFLQTINPKTKWGLTSAFSFVDSERSSEIDTFATPQPRDLVKLSTQKLSTNAFVQYKFNTNNKLNLGLSSTWLNDSNVNTFFNPTEFTTGGSIEGILSQPYLNWELNHSNLTFNLGGRYTHFSFNNTSEIEPSTQLYYRLPKNQNIGASYGLQSQRQLPDIYHISEESALINNTDLELTKAHHASLWYENIWNQVRFKSEIYYQSLFDVPIASEVENSFSALNVFEEVNSFQLENEGTGTNYGIEISLQQYFSKNAFWLANVSLFESKYIGSDGIERDTRFNGNYIANAVYGREFPYSKKGKDYILGVNLRLNYAGGLRQTPIDLENSERFQQTIFDTREAFSLRQQDYFKADLRIYWKRNKKKFNSTLALDIQNVSNQKNPSFQTFDTFQNQVLQQYQLGLIPILSYRIEF